MQVCKNCCSVCLLEDASLSAKLVNACPHWAITIWQILSKQANFDDMSDQADLMNYEYVTERWVEG